MAVRKDAALWRCRDELHPKWLSSMRWRVARAPNVTCWNRCICSHEESTGFECQVFRSMLLLLLRFSCCVFFVKCACCSYRTNASAFGKWNFQHSWHSLAQWMCCFIHTCHLFTLLFFLPVQTCVNHCMERQAVLEWLFYLHVHREMQHNDDQPSMNIMDDYQIPQEMVLSQYVGVPPNHPIVLIHF